MKGGAPSAAAFLPKRSARRREEMMSQAPWSFESNAGSFRFFCDGRLKNQTKDERALPLGDRANK